MFTELVKENRSCRRFYENQAVEPETVGPDNSIRYWRDNEGVHHVPKRKLEDVIVKIIF